jgi:hypothetical protein
MHADAYVSYYRSDDRRAPIGLSVCLASVLRHATPKVCLEQEEDYIIAVRWERSGANKSHDHDETAEGDKP